MKKLILFSAIAALLFNACSDDDTPGDETYGNDYDFSAIIADYVDYTVVPTYADMKDKSALMLGATEDFLASGSQDDINLACEYWKQTRQPWECSEAFLFGPAANQSLDPLLDSWPLDQAQLDQVLASNQTIDAAYVKDALGAVLRGFHTIEYLLFRDGQARVASEVSDREKEYLVAVTEVLRDDCLYLWALWAGVDDGTDEAALVEELELEIGTPYAEVLKNAGNAGSIYLSQTDAVDEILLGISGIADEVANAKIADPVSSGDVLEVESWFSWNSLTDFQNNVKSIENSYLGGYDGGTSGACLSDYVKEKDADLDTKVKGLITDAIDAIADIPYPFRNNLNNEEKVNAAMDAVNAVASVFDEEVRPLFID